MDQLIQSLKEALQTPRARLRSKQAAAPPVTATALPGLPAIHALEVTFSPGECNVDKLLRHWLRVVFKDEEQIQQAVARGRSFLADPQAFHLPISPRPGSSRAGQLHVSMRMAKFVPAEGGDGEERVRVSVYVDEGFRREHVDCVARGYEEGFSPPIAPSPFRLNRDALP
eukprot:gene42977-52525_t